MTSMGNLLRVGFSFYGFLERPKHSDVVETPDGLRGERYLMVDVLLSRGHDVFQLQPRRERRLFNCGVEEFDHCYVNDEYASPALFPELDVIFVEWRWPRMGKSTEDWDRQVELLDHYTRVGTPIVVLDTDLKVSVTDELRWPKMIVCDPCIVPKRCTRERVKMPFCSTFERRHRACAGSVHYRYVGNNYERDAQFMQFVSSPAEELRHSGVQTTVHGNWLTRSVERIHPRGLLQAHPHVAFVPRLAYKDVHAALNDSVATCHITKPEYALHGNVTMRYFEALAASVPALVPADCVPLRQVGDACGLLVNTHEDVVRKVRNLADMSAHDREHLVLAQERELRALADFSPEHRVDMIEAAARKELSA